MKGLPGLRSANRDSAGGRSCVANASYFKLDPTVRTPEPADCCRVPHLEQGFDAPTHELGSLGNSDEQRPWRTYVRPHGTIEVVVATTAISWPQLISY
jgi:hypothetical protein